MKDYGQGLVDIYKQKIAPNQQAVIDQFKVQQVSDAEVKAEFEKLEAQDSSLNDLIQRATNLQQSKASFATDLSNMLQKIAAQQATINKDLLAKDSLQQNVASTAAQLDHKLMVAVRDLELRARERLFRYQYYMAKAYEYRMLQQYPSDLNLDSTIKQIDSLITKSYPPDPSVFSTVNPTTIKSVYLTAVREIVDKTLQDSSSQSIEKQQLLKFDLTADELAALNKLPIAVNQWLPIDVSQRIAPLLGEDNRHISDIVFDQVKVQTTGAIGSFARMRILVAHDGRSVQSLNGHQYNFYFGLRPEDTPFFWDASYDIPSGSLDQAKPSPSAIYQLISLLQLPPTSDPSVLFARPGADRVILYVRREPQPVTLNAQITKLTLAVKVDFFRRNSNLVTVSVQSGNVQPYIGIDKNDVTNRADGLGNFQRTYNSGDSVTLSAEPFHGNLKFRYWADDAGHVLSTSSTFTLTLTAATSVHPVYIPLVAPVPTAVFRDSVGAISLSRQNSSTLARGGGVFASDPAVAQNLTGDSFAIARDNFGSVWANTFAASTLTWGTWRPGSGFVQGTPAIAVAIDGTAYVAARDNFNSYWLTSYTSADGFLGWTYLAGTFSIDPVMAASSDGSIYIVGKDTYNALWSGRYIPGLGFQGWRYGAGILKGKPSVTVGTDGVGYVAARDNGDSLWIARVQGNNWLGWSYGGGVMNSDPQIVALGNGTVAAILPDPGHVIWYRGYSEGTSNGWQAWISTGGLLMNAAAAGAGGEVYVAGKDPNNDLWWYHSSGNQWTWIGNRGAANGSIAAAPR